MKKLLLNSVLSLALLYIAASFITLSLDFTDWSIGLRIIYVCLVAFFSMYHLFEQKEKQPVDIAQLFTDALYHAEKVLIAKMPKAYIQFEQAVQVGDQYVFSIQHDRFGNVHFEVGRIQHNTHTYKLKELEDPFNTILKVLDKI